MSNKEREKLLQERGFKDFREYGQLITQVDMSSQGLINKFRFWEGCEGTKDDLLTKFRFKEKEEKIEKAESFFVCILKRLLSTLHTNGEKGK